MNNRWISFACGCTYVFVFAFLFYFYVVIQPAILWDSDDWNYFSQFRDMFPSFTRWNPARILPEILQPFMGWFASIFFHLGLNYVEASALVHALFLAIFISLLYIVIEALFTDIFDDRKLGFFLAVLFFVLAFGMLKSRPNGNIFLFSAGSITTTCFYVIPNIINSLLLCFIVHGQFTGKDILAGRHWAIGLMCLLVFLAQFSMTPSSILSSTYAGFVLLYKYLTQASKGILHKTKQFVAGLTTYDCILILAVLFWIIAAICDMNGGRYNKIRNDEWNFSAALDTFSALMTQFNIVTSVVAFVIFIVTFLRMVWKHKTGRWTNKDVDYLNVIRTSFLSMVMILAFLLLVSSHTSARLIGRMSAAYSLFFLAVLSLLFCIAFLLSEKPKLRYIAPIIFVLLLVEATNPERPYANGQGTPHHKAIIQGWVNGIIQADRIGKKDATIQVPVAEWPHPASNLGPRISRTLFAHGVTERRMHIAIEEDPSLANANNWRTILGNEK